MFNFEVYLQIMNKKLLNEISKFVRKIYDCIILAFIYTFNLVDIFNILLFTISSMKKELVLFFILVLITNSLETIAIIGTNDIHGAAFPTSLRR